MEDMVWITEHEGQAGYKNIHFNKDGDHIYCQINTGNSSELHSFFPLIHFT